MMKCTNSPEKGSLTGARYCLLKVILAPEPDDI